MALSVLWHVVLCFVDDDVMCIIYFSFVGVGVLCFVGGFLFVGGFTVDTLGRG